MVQYGMVQYSTVWYSTVQYSTVQYSTVQYSTVQYSTVQYGTVWYSSVQYNSHSQELISVLHTIQNVTVPCSNLLYQKCLGTKGSKGVRGQKVLRVPGDKRCYGCLGQKLRRSTCETFFFKIFCNFSLSMILWFLARKKEGPIGPWNSSQVIFS